MNTPHFILGTAGHVDHGKTSLIKALSGIDCDTHPEEKIRGITIHLGFSHINLPNGSSFGIVDVPGHKDFINTMIAGACGIDLVMLVIAADSGVMPQTIEHVQISNLLGIKSGFIVITKIDLVDEEILSIVEEEIKEFTKNSFLKDAPIFKVSSKTGDGIQDLIRYLSCIAKLDSRKSIDAFFRMFIDRNFSISGFGTVVTGSVISGKINVDENLYLLPGNKEFRVRRLERHGNQVDEVIAGDRAAINLAGIKKEDFCKGMVLCSKLIEPTQMADAELTIINSHRRIELWSRVIFIIGTFESIASIHLIDKDNLSCGENGLVQIHIESPSILQKGDRFIIRNSSNDITLGGGMIIDPHPLHHRRRTPKVIDELKYISKGSVNALIVSEIKKHHFPTSLKCIAEQQNILQKEIEDFTLEAIPPEITFFKRDNDLYFIRTEQLNQIKKRIVKNLEHYQKLYPLDESGKTFEELMGIWGLQRNETTEEIMKSILHLMEKEKIISQTNSLWTTFGYRVILTDRDKKEIYFVEQFHKNCGLNTPLMSELLPKSISIGISENKLMQILALLCKQRKLYCIDDNYLHFTVVEKYRFVLLNYLEKHSEGITVAQFRDLINGNRKLCLLLLTQYDREGYTSREGDLRFISEKGIKLLRQRDNN